MIKNKQLKEIGNRLKEVRKHFKLTQVELAEAAGISDSQISESESGKRGPSTDVLLYLSSEKAVNLNYIFTGRGSMFGESADLSRFDEVHKKKVTSMIEMMAEDEFILFSVLAQFLKSKDGD